MDFLVFGLLVAAIPFVLPIAAWVAARRTRARVDMLDQKVAAQADTIDLLKAQVAELRRQGREEPSTLEVPAAPAPRPAAPPLRPPVVEPSPAPAHPAPSVPPAPPIAVPAPIAVPPPAVAAPPIAARVAAAPPIATPPPAVLPPRPPRPPQPPPPERGGFDWESIVGVKLFSAIAGIALVFAAVFFLLYSVEHGWLQPPVRVIIGIIVAVSLLVVCELKAARQYPATANALDAAAIAILFSTFFAAHALWDLIPALAAFALLAVVTAIAVLLSIRRDSLFIAVLGLLGGFATPALLSSGENRPIPLFAYLMLLNVGLAWVAYRRTWPLLTSLTLVFTTIYQWTWVWKFLGQSELTLAMGIFLVFPIATIAALMLARPRRPGASGAPGDIEFERTAVIAAALPLLFAVYLSAVPQYGAHPGLLFGFLLLVDAGLFAIAIVRRKGMLHSAGAIATVLVMAVWLAISYTHAAAYIALAFCAAFVALFALAPVAAAWLGRPLDDEGADAVFAAPLLLFAPAVLARIEPAFAAPLPLFATVFVLVILVAWRAIESRRGALYFIAAFMAIAAQAAWSMAHLEIDRLGTAVAVYGVFGVLSIAVPLVARRMGRPLEPAAGGGAVLIASLALLGFLSLGPIAPATLWALALLLAIINAGLFVESASGALPLLSIAGSVLSWVILASWWLRAAAVVGVIPSLAVLAGLTLVTMGGHAWMHARTVGLPPEGGSHRFSPTSLPPEGGSHRVSPTSLPPSGGSAPPNMWLPPSGGRSLREGLYLGLIGHLFLIFVVLNPAWSLPPWPWLATLAVITLAASTLALATRVGALHAAGVAAAALIVTVWTNAAAAPAWSMTAIVASAVVSAFALGWLQVARSRGIEPDAAIGAAASLFLGEATAVAAVAAGGAPFAATVVAHAANLSALLALTWAHRWRHVALWAVAAASCGALAQWQSGDLTTAWTQLLIVSFAIYAVFTAYPIVLGSRARGERDPYIAAVLASAMFFFAAREALNAGGYRWMVGVLPVAEGAVMTLLLRQLLRIEPAGERDLGRLALVAGASLAFVTIAIPLQLRQQWITIGWALEAAALAWLYRRIPHRGLLAWSAALFGAVFARLALNPEIFQYEPRGALRIFNWYLYTYLICAAAFLVAAWWLSETDDTLPPLSGRLSRVLPACAVVLLFLLLNIEIADYYATGPAIMFRFGVTVSQDLTYTIGWLLFGMGLLAVCIYLHNRIGRVTALALIALTTFKCFLYDLGSLGGLYRVASFVGLAVALALVSLALQKYVLSKPEGAR